MDWTMLGAVGEIIGAIAVVLSLLYVGRQVRQNNTMARGQLRQELSSERGVWAMAIATSPELSATFSKVHFHGLLRDQANDLERTQMSYALSACIAQIQLAFEQAKEGIITQGELSEAVGPALPLMKAPYAASTWPILQPGYPQDFAAWFEERFGFKGEVLADQLEA